MPRLYRELILTQLGMQELAFWGNKTNAQKYLGTANIVFIDNNTSPEDKTYLLYHELGHILLNHIKVGRMNTQNKILMDIEANAFVYFLLHPRKKKVLAPLVAIITFVSCVGAATAYNISNIYTKETSTENSISTVEMIPTPSTNPISTTPPEIYYVYVSSTGKYHRDSCIHAKDKNYLRLDIAEAKKIINLVKFVL